MRRFDANKAVADNKKIMSVNAETMGAGKATDVVLLTVAVLVLIAGIAAYYLLPTTVSPMVHVLSFVAGLVVAGGLTWFTGPGRGVRGYLRETQFEMRKVVWPTREETIRTTLVVILVVILLSIVLGLIDLFLKWAILDHLLKM
ncbi:MAG: preprotein translocase subunit SecE [Gemmataceae bacterium]